MTTTTRTTTTWMTRTKRIARSTRRVPTSHAGPVLSPCCYRDQFGTQRLGDSSHVTAAHLMFRIRIDQRADARKHRAVPDSAASPVRAQSRSSKTSNFFSVTV